MSEARGADSPFVRAILREGGVDTTIDLRDEMLLHVLKEHGWDFALTSYFQRGLEAAQLHERIVDHFFGRREIEVLDFASGFGRVTRFFVAKHGCDRVTIADVQQDAVTFQTRHFGVDGILSTNDPAAFHPHKFFDCIVALSFFSHVPPAKFALWLSKLAGMLNDRGVLVFTVHDDSLLDPARRGAGGITFEATSESDRLDTADYGTTWVSETFVREAAARLGRSLIRIPRGLASFQDVYILHSRGADEQFDFDQGPFGFASIARLADDDELHLIGWAAHRNASRRVQRVTIELNGVEVASTASFFPRPDVVDHLGDSRFLESGWHASFRIPQTCSRMTDVLVVKAISDRAAETIVYAGTIAGVLLESARAELRSAGRESVVFPAGDELRRELIRYTSPGPKSKV